MVIKSCPLLMKDTETCVGSSLASYFVLFSLISLVSFYFVFISLISFRFVSFLFRFALYRYPTIIEILPSRISPIGCDLPMSVRLSLTPSWFYKIPRTNESVSIGVFTTLFPLVGTLTLLNLKLVLLEYYSCSSSLFSRLLILFFIELI
jgi:hypothetical protein